ncbi:SDR family oxidoreductase [Kaustia mangrovi]|uniref:SDR family oxidoreductase n=1 Tax=Kaustia mangrovi TaxID=2593653 RepID=A0A7S8C650_9HYPH|nr:SDR family oxidoreductase [Kaustia mangrovi]QPC44105.1 SDR family oxidoreductase [Kaustia mangrovi]
MELTGRRALVTGAGSGIGRACADTLATHGAEVIVQDIDPARVSQAVAEIEAAGHAARALACDVADEAALKAAVADAGPVHILVNNAGVAGNNAPLEEIDRAAFDRMMNTHVWGAHAAMRACIAGMKEARWGRIVNIGSNRGQVGFERSSHYCAAKAALIAMAKAWAREFAPWGILANAIAPGVTRTAMTLAYGEQAVDEEARENLLSRAASPEEIAAWVAVLCGPTGDFMTGQLLCPNGGDPIVGI